MDTLILILHLKNAGDFKNIVASIVDLPIRLVNIAFAKAFSSATLRTTGGKKMEQNKDVVHVSAKMRLLTSKEGDLL